MAFRAPFDPDVDNDETQGFEVNGEWLNTDTQSLFRLDDATEDAAVWTDITGGAPHAALHQDGGTDEIDVTGLSGLLGDAQTPASHALGGHTGVIGDIDGYTKSEVDVLVDAALKAPEAFAPSGTYPVTYDGAAVQRGDSFRITGDGTMGAITVNVEDLLIALVDTPAQVDANWMVAESNRDQATETVKGVAQLATQAEADAGTNDTNIVTPLKMATAPVNAHTVASHSDTSATGAQLDALVGGGETTLHTHPGGGGSGDVVGPASVVDDRLAVFDGTTGKLIKQGSKTSTEVGSHLDSTINPHGVTAAQAGAAPTAHTHTHASTTGQGADDHHNESHTVASHSDTAATGPELNTLTDGSNADALHSHAAASVAHSATTGQTANDHHSEDHASRHQNGGADELNVGGLSGLLADAQTPASHVHDATDVTSGVLADARVQQSNVTQHQAAIDHDALSGFEAGEHRVINDAGTSATELWSANKIDAELATVGSGTIFPDRGCVQAKDGAQLIGVSSGDVQSDDGLLILTLASAGQINLAASGVDGLDTGTVAADTHYSVWVIGDSTATNPTATLASLSTTSPTLPSGYDRKRRRGWILTDGSSNIHSFIARGGNGERTVMYTYTRTDALVFALLDTQIWLAQSLSAQLPPTAQFADLSLVVDTGNSDYLETRPTGSTVADGEGRRVWGKNNFTPTIQWQQVLNGSQSLDWRKNDASGDASLYVWGYGEMI